MTNDTEDILDQLTAASSSLKSNPELTRAKAHLHAAVRVLKDLPDQRPCYAAVSRVLEQLGTPAVTNRQPTLH